MIVANMPKAEGPGETRALLYLDRSMIGGG